MGTLYPKKHLALSNTIVRDDEKQNSQKMQGALTVIFESKCSVHDLINESCFDLKYISTKNTQFETHENGSDTKKFDTLNYEIMTVFTKMFRDKSENAIARSAYISTGKLIHSYQKTRDTNRTINEVFSSIRLCQRDYKNILQALEKTDDTDENKICVQSIDSIKGQEGNNCLFVLTTDLAEYLFAKKTGYHKSRRKIWAEFHTHKHKLLTNCFPIIVP